MNFMYPPTQISIIMNFIFIVIQIIYIIMNFMYPLASRTKLCHASASANHSSQIYQSALLSAPCDSHRGM